MADILIPFAQVWGLTILLAALFVCAGLGFYRAAFVRRASENPFFLAGLGYFLGMFLFLFLLRLAGVRHQGDGSARLACWLALAAMAVLAVQSLRQGLPGGAGVYLRRVLPAMVVLTLVGLLSPLTFWTQETLSINAWTGFGSGHSGRYANIALVAVEKDTLPRLGQNYGQSLLVAAHLFLKVQSPLASLTAWLTVTLAMLTLFLYGLFRPLLASAALAGVAAFLFLACNIALSLMHVFVLANGSPILFMPYTDALTSVATCVLFVLWLHDLVASGRQPWYKVVLVPLLFGSVWNLCSPENMVTCSVLIAVLAVIALVNAALPLPRLSAAGVALAGGIVLGATQGGMLLPREWAHDFPIPGVASYGREAARRLEWDPGLEYMVVRGTGWDLGRNFYPEYPELPVFRFESYLWTALRLLFYPVLGILGLAVLGLLNGEGEAPAEPLAPARQEPRPPKLGPPFPYGRRPEPKRAEAPPAERFGFWALCAAVVLAVGFALEFCFSFLNPLSGSAWDAKWDLARFLISGVALGLVCLVFFVHRLAQAVPYRGLRALAWLGVTALATAGPVVSFVHNFHHNFVALWDVVPWPDRLRVLFHTREVLPETYAEKLITALKNGDVPARRKAAGELTMLASYYPEIAMTQEALDQMLARGHAGLRDALNDPDEEVRRLAAQALVKIKGAEAAEAIPALVEALKSRDDRARREAAQHLMEFGPAAQGEEAVGLLTRLLQRSSERTRVAAALALVKVQGPENPEVIPVLTEGLSEPGTPVRKEYARALGQFGPAAAEAFLSLSLLLYDGDPEVRCAAAVACVQVAGAEAVAAVPALAEGLKEGAAPARRACAAALGALGPLATEGAHALVDALADGNEEVRRAAACALVAVRGAEAVEAVPVLLEGLRDTRPDVRQLCQATLEQLGPEAGRVIEALTHAVQEAEQFRDAAAEILKKIQQKGKEGGNP